jgi:hypothetical protein
MRDSTYLNYDSTDMIIKMGEKQPKVTSTTAIKEAVEAFTSSPCLPHDCFTFIRVSFVINSSCKPM